MNRLDSAVLIGNVFGSPCLLCYSSPGVVLKRGFRYDQGVQHNTNVVFCLSCFESKEEECNMVFDLIWEGEWEGELEKAEANWKKYGVYTNVMDDDKPCKKLGYVKLENGRYEPYKYVYPSNPEELLISKIDKYLDETKQPSDVLKQGVRQIADQIIDLDDVRREELVHSAYEVIEKIVSSSS